MITLSVDDQKEARELMLYMLNKIDPNGTHLSASNMKEAMSLINDDVQIIFLDIEMPGLNGVEATPLLKDKYKKLNIIYVTGHPEYVFDAVGMHPSGFLTKPVCEEDIIHEFQDNPVVLKSVYRKIPYGKLVMLVLKVYKPLYMGLIRQDLGSYEEHQLIMRRFALILYV